MARTDKIKIAVLLAGFALLLAVSGLGLFIIFSLAFSAAVPHWVPIFLALGFFLALAALADLFRRLYSTII